MSSGVVAFALCLAALGARVDLCWIDEAQRLPAQLPEDAPKLSDLVADAQGQRIATAQAWAKRRAELREKWLRFLGPFLDAPRCPLNPQVLSTARLGGVTRKLVKLQVEPGVWMEAYLLHPAEPKGKLPGVVVFHSTVRYTIRQPAGLEGAEEKWIGLHLAEQGMVALCPRCFLWEPEGRGLADAVDRLHQRHPDWRGMAKMIFDGMRAADYLQTLPFVDRERLGCIGHSLGGKEALFVAAFDERFRAVVSSEGGIGLGFSNWEAPWYLGPEIRQPGFAMDNHEVLALVAPRPFLLIGGGASDGEKSWPYVAAVLPIYRLLGAENNVGLINHGEGHAFPTIAQLRAYEWLAAHLGAQGAIRAFTLDGKTVVLRSEFYDDFSAGMDNWVVEGQPRVEVREGKLFAFASDNKPNVNTIWCRRDFSGDAVVEFDACVLAGSDKDNINFFLYATQNDGSDVLLTSAQRTGAYKEYHQFPNYIYTFLTDTNPETNKPAGRARFRKDPGFVLLAEKWVEPLVKGHVYHIAIVVQGPRMRYYVDGRLVHDFRDSPPLYRRGKHAFRTWRTNLWFDNFRVSGIVQPGG